MEQPRAIVCRVVAMPPPVAGLDMDLDVAYPFPAVDAQTGVEEIRAGIPVVDAGIDDFHIVAADCEAFAAHHPLLPEILI